MADTAVTTNKKLAKFGASGFEYGVVGDDDFVLSTRKIQGLSSVKLDIKTEQKTLSADDGPYLILSGGITEATETIEMYDVDSVMKSDLFGIKVVNGVEVYPKNLNPNYAATLFRTKLSNGKYVWVGMLKGMFSLPGVDTKTVDGTPDPSADSIEGAPCQTASSARSCRARSPRERSTRTTNCSPSMTSTPGRPCTF